MDNLKCLKSLIYRISILETILSAYNWLGEFILYQDNFTLVTISSFSKPGSLIIILDYNSEIGRKN